MTSILFLVGFIPYVISVLVNRNDPTKAKPSKTSWIIWAVLDIITLIGMYFKDSVTGISMGAAIGTGSTALLALRYGKLEWTKVDKFTFAGAGVGLLLWGLFRNPDWAIVASQTTLFIGAIPTFVSAWQNPNAESKFAWTIWFVACLVGLVFVSQWTLAGATQLVVFSLETTVIMVIFCIKYLKGGCNEG